MEQSSSSSSDCEQDISDHSLDISGTQSESESEEIIPPSPKRIKRITNKQIQKLDVLQMDETSQPTNFCTSPCNPLQHHTIQQHTSCNNHSPPSPVCILQPTSYKDTEIDTPKTNNHVEPNDLPCVEDNNPVPEPIFTIDLDIQTSPPEYSPNENIIQLSEIIIIIIIIIIIYSLLFYSNKDPLRKKINKVLCLTLGAPALLLSN